MLGPLAWWESGALLVFSCSHLSYRISVFSCLTCLNSGNVDLPRILPFLGKSQLQVLSVVVSLLLLIGHLIMAMLVKEPVLRSKSQRKSFRQEIKDLWSNMRTLPRVIRQIVSILLLLLILGTNTYLSSVSYSSCASSLSCQEFPLNNNQFSDGVVSISLLQHNLHWRPLQTGLSSSHN